MQISVSKRSIKATHMLSHLLSGIGTIQADEPFASYLNAKEVAERPSSKKEKLYLN